MYGARVREEYCKSILHTHCAQTMLEISNESWDHKSPKKPSIYFYKYIKRLQLHDTKISKLELRNKKG